MSSELFAAPPLAERLFLGDDEREGEREDEVSPAAGSLGIANRCGPELAREVGVGSELVALAGPPGAAPGAAPAAPAEVGVPRAAPL